MFLDFAIAFHCVCLQYSWYTMKLCPIIFLVAMFAGVVLAAPNKGNKMIIVGMSGLR